MYNLPKPTTRIRSVLKINKVIKVLTYSFLLVLSGWGLILPVFAVFVTEHIPGGSLEVVGIATTIYLITRSILQIPAAIFLDLKKGEKDDFWMMFTGMILVALAALSYVFANSVAHLFLIQLLYGLGDGLVVPSSNAIFVRHTDAKNVAVENTFYQTIVDVGVAVSASVGAFLILMFGYRPVFILVSLFNFMGALLLILIYSDMYKRNI